MEAGDAVFACDGKLEPLIHDISFLIGAHGATHCMTHLDPVTKDHLLIEFAVFELAPARGNPHRTCFVAGQIGRPASSCGFSYLQEL